jgi:hypothetical protein
MARRCPDIHRVFTAIDIALQTLGFLLGGDHRPAWPCANRHAPLPPGGAVDQDEGLAARQEHAEAEACACLIKDHIFARANFSSLYNSFGQMRSHAGPPIQADSGVRIGKEQPALCARPECSGKPGETNRQLIWSFYGWLWRFAAKPKICTDPIILTSAHAKSP